jgi:type II secretory pathway pseudopilin PulG
MILLNSKKQGFALLMSLIVVSVVISIGLSVLDLTLKQIRLSTNSKDSEIVFHATNAGLECARYWLSRDDNSDGDIDIENGETISPKCFGVDSDPVTVSKTSPAGTTGGVAYKYNMDFTWGASLDRCSKITILTLVSASNATTTVSSMTTVIPGYPTVPDDKKECGPSGRCSVISVQGFNRACDKLDLQGTLQREVLLQL